MPQKEKYDCVPTCICMILKYYGYYKDSINIKKISKMLQCEKNGTFIYGTIFTNFSTRLQRDYHIPITFHLTSHGTGVEGWVDNMNILRENAPSIFFYDLNLYLDRKVDKDKNTKKNKDFPEILHATVVSEFTNKKIIGNDPLNSEGLGENTYYDYQRFIMAWNQAYNTILLAKKFDKDLLNMKKRHKKGVLGIEDIKQLTLNGV